MLARRPSPPVGTGTEFRRQWSGLRVRSHTYLIMARLVAGVMVCWLPGMAYFVVKRGRPLCGVPAYFEAASNLYSYEFVMDAIHLASALSCHVGRVHCLKGKITERMMNARHTTGPPHATPGAPRETRWGRSSAVTRTRPPWQRKRGR